MQLRYVFSELRQGLRRNLSMNVAVVLTLFVSLALAGGGLLLQRQADRTAEVLGDQLQIMVNLCTVDDPSGNANCAGGEVTDPQRTEVERALEESSEVATYEFQTKAEGFAKAKESYPPEVFEGEDPVISEEDWPAAYWVTLEDPSEADGVTSAVRGLDGVSGVQDPRDELRKIFGIIDSLEIGSWAGAGVLLVAALLLVANTIRLAAIARRREIEIMRLVGASTLYIALPFLLEALVAAVVGAGLAALALAAFLKLAIMDGLAEALGFLPWVGWDDYVQVLIGTWPPGIALIAPALTLIPTLLLARKYTRV
ncbi:permease-like cell division protein FtsX [Nocardioides panacisoli]|uniref:permease-like cell division protein FtsX n=1 Tax=Nocardioides panacisoli TaxID=627624 RepID=UPI001C634090|nr:permease-like cell division protein FtsX [Nocardioides panacisoli]QYJ04250.1 permease-like cell division protein FtsX [Nocardioides panacisoli]